MKIKDDGFYKFVRDFLTIYLPKQCRLSNNTIKSYRITLNQYIDYLIDEKHIPMLQITLNDLNQDNVNGFLDWLQETKNCLPSSRNQKLMALRSFAKYCSVIGIENISLRLEICKVPVQNVPGKKLDFMSEEELKTILSIPDLKNYYGLRNGFFMFLLYDTGARCQEMLDLKIENFVISKKENTSYVNITGKGQKVRSVPLMDKTVEHYKRYIKFFHPENTRHPSDNLFYTVIHQKRGPMSPDTVDYFLRKYVRKARKNNPNFPHIHPHMFRHTRAIHWYRSGIPLSIVSELLGHENIETTRIYAYANTEMKATAISKATNSKSIPDSNGTLWTGDRDKIKRLYGLKK